MSVALFYDPLFLEHVTEPEHPESPARLTACLERLRAAGLWDALAHPRCRPAPWEALAACHDPRYLELLQETAILGGGQLTSDTPFGEHSFDAARLASGAALGAADGVLAGEFGQAFVLARPPGHHAARAAGMGFCLLNHVAVAARHLVRRRGLERVLIADFDIHHGNGTQEIFEEEPAVYYASTHQYPAYPGTGSLWEVGRAAGEGFTLNAPLPPGVGDEGLRRVYDEVIAPAAHRFRPQFILVSAGYDAHWANAPYLSSIAAQVTVTGLLAVVGRLRELALELCEGRLALVLEGGYELEALAWSVAGTLGLLLGREAEDPLGPSPAAAPEPDLDPLLAQLRELHSLVGS